MIIPRRRTRSRCSTRSFTAETMSIPSAGRTPAPEDPAFRLVTDEAINFHLRDRETFGVYPMLPGGACKFLAVDFDKAT